MQITDRDRELLEFVSRHRLVHPAHVGALLGVSAKLADYRLRALARAGLLERDKPFTRRPVHYQITRPGLRLIGSRLPRPKRDLGCYEHDVGAAWLWLAARAGSFGPVSEVLAERELRSHDGRPEGRERPLAVRLGGAGPAGRDRLHYPDLLLVSENGRRVALELELTAKGRTRREAILTGYCADARVDAVLYLVERRSIGLAIQASARKLGISSLVHVQLVRRPEAALGPAPGLTVARRHDRAPAEAEAAR